MSERERERANRLRKKERHGWKAAKREFSECSERVLIALAPVNFDPPL